MKIKFHDKEKKTAEDFVNILKYCFFSSYLYFPLLNSELLGTSKALISVPENHIARCAHYCK